MCAYTVYRNINIWLREFYAIDFQYIISTKQEVVKNILTTSISLLPLSQAKEKNLTKQYLQFNYEIT